MYNTVYSEPSAGLLKKETGLMNSFFDYAAQKEQTLHESGEFSEPGGVNRETENSVKRGLGPNIYRDLIFYRYYEAITSIYPVFCERAGEAKVSDLVTAFVKHGGSSPYIWRMGGQFKDFVLQNKHRTNDIDTNADRLNDLLWYEWNQAQLHMNDLNRQFGVSANERSKTHHTTFDWARRIVPAPWAAKKRIDYAVHTDCQKIENTALILYYDFPEKAVCYQEITDFVFKIIKQFSYVTPEKAFALVCRQYGLLPEQIEEAKNMCENVLENLWNKRILIRASENQ